MCPCSFGESAFSLVGCSFSSFSGSAFSLVGLCSFGGSVFSLVSLCSFGASAVSLGGPHSVRGPCSVW